ncbi:MAG: hypothetical protein ACI8VC_001131 [Candidatus Endobugula sp.]|jgi:hypothetical protein
MPNADVKCHYVGVAVTAAAGVSGCFSISLGNVMRDIDVIYEELHMKSQG